MPLCFLPPSNHGNSVSYLCVTQMLLPFLSTHTDLWADMQVTPKELLLGSLPSLVSHSTRTTLLRLFTTYGMGLKMHPLCLHDLRTPKANIWHGNVKLLNEGRVSGRVICPVPITRVWWAFEAGGAHPPQHAHQEKGIMGRKGAVALCLTFLQSYLQPRTAHLHRRCYYPFKCHFTCEPLVVHPSEKYVLDE